MDTITARYLEEARWRHNELLTKGYDPIRALGITVAHYRLSMGTSQLDGLTQPQQDFPVNVCAVGNGNPTFLPHHNALLPAWEKFTKALSSVPPVLAKKMDTLNLT